jgi:hypothetical protein
VQQDHLAGQDAEDHSRNAAAGKIAANFPKTPLERAAVRHPDRPAELDLLDVVADGSAITLSRVPATIPSPACDQPLKRRSDR